MTKKTIKNQQPSFIQSINIAKDWCKEWEDEFLSDEVLADRIKELIKTRNGIRGFFAYTLSDSNCTLLDKLPSSIIYIFREIGESVVEITIKNLFMSSAQIVSHQKDKNFKYAAMSENISERCINLLKELDTHLVTNQVNVMLTKLDQMGNSFDPKIKFNETQKIYIRNKIKEIAQ